MEYRVDITLFHISFLDNMMITEEENRENIGLVVRSTGLTCIVKNSFGKEFSCTIKGKFRNAGIKTTNPVAVGDYVHFIEGNKFPNPQLEDTSYSDDKQYYLIDKILPRKNYIIRRSTNLSKLYSVIAANVDMAFLMVCCKDPKTDTMFIDRFLVTALAYNVPATIVINKVDTYNNESKMYANFLIDIYEKIGIDVLLTSCKDNIGIEELKSMLHGKVSLFVGGSGVGKSTMVNMICPNSSQKTANVSAKYHTGKHTTTFASMIEYEDMKIIDTAGVKSFGIVDFKKEELALYFPEMKERLPSCKYYNCTHTNEPHCAVKTAVEEGKISKERYNNYIKLLNADDML